MKHLLRVALGSVPGTKAGVKELRAVYLHAKDVVKSWITDINLQGDAQQKEMLYSSLNLALIAAKADAETTARSANVTFTRWECNNRTSPEILFAFLCKYANVDSSVLEGKYLKYFTWF